MALSRLQEDLLGDFREQKYIIDQQLEVFNPLGNELNKPAARHLVDKSLLIGAEILCYVLSAGAAAAIVFLPKLYPFNILQELRYKQAYSKLGWLNIEAFNASVYGILAIIAILFLFLAIAMRSIRLKNDILQFAAANIKTLVGQHLKRKAAIETISQRHFMEPIDSLNDPM